MQISQSNAAEKGLLFFSLTDNRQFVFVLLSPQLSGFPPFDVERQNCKPNHLHTHAAPTFTTIRFAKEEEATLGRCYSTQVPLEPSSVPHFQQTPSRLQRSEDLCMKFQAMMPDGLLLLERLKTVGELIGDNCMPDGCKHGKKSR